ncbi:MAG: cation transporter [Clostridia bacterium]|nr:cation transporter [Clostridia bacterium]
MGNGIIILLLLALGAFAIVKTVRKMSKGSGCCGEHEQTPEKVRVADRNKAHYPFCVEAEIGGMTCTNCARRVENALNAEDGVYASVNYDKKSVQIYSKQEMNMDHLREIIREAGYVLQKPVQV